MAWWRWWEHSCTPCAARWPAPSRSAPSWPSASRRWEPGARLQSGCASGAATQQSGPKAGPQRSNPRAHQPQQLPGAPASRGCVAKPAKSAAALYLSPHARTSRAPSPTGRSAPSNCPIAPPASYAAGRRLRRLRGSRGCSADMSSWRAGWRTAGRAASGWAGSSTPRDS